MQLKIEDYILNVIYTVNNVNKTEQQASIATENSL